ncbi:hypothetical protein Vadar_034689 [Vaccinium darrowii]|uniref:Uncharacterized protein n=1 Tax=Vaccinium darrowii TaxID=229202 RepID=A0ACB7ZNS2_9ERIC|nr:hypothetical protein Vadar_034689 [Vaccinium darrowii]
MAEGKNSKEILRVVTSTDINPLAWLACLQVVDGNSYQFCIQPPDAKLYKRESTKQFHNFKITSCWHPTRSLGGQLGPIKCR